MTHWSRLTERGSILGLRFVAACYRLFGERAARLVLYPVVAYFLVTGGEARRSSIDYFRRLRSYAGADASLPAPGWATAYHHMLAFAESGLHKFAAWMGNVDGLQVDFPDRALLDRVAAEGRGALLISGHLGNLEMTRALAAASESIAVTAVVYSEHAPRFHQLLAQAGGKYGVNLVQVSQIGPETMIMLRQKVDHGELLVIVGDRTPSADNGRTCVVDFLGSPAPFAQGPYILGALLECPVLLFFCLKQGGGYRIHLEPFSERLELPRAGRSERLREYAQRFADRLAHYCMLAPYQWFNFYNYWDKGLRHQDGKRSQRGGAQADSEGNT